MSLKMVELNYSFYFTTVDHQLTNRSSRQSYAGSRVLKGIGYCDQCVIASDHTDKNHQPSKLFSYTSSILRVHAVSFDA